MKKGERENTEGIDLPNQKSIRTLEKKKEIANT